MPDGRGCRAIRWATDPTEERRADGGYRTTMRPVSRSSRPPSHPDRRDGSGALGRLRVLRVSKSGVVTAWRERERQLRLAGADLTLVAAAGGKRAGLGGLHPDGDDFAEPVRTVGRHPNLFLYDPRPLWRLLGSATGTSSTSTRSRSGWPWPRCSFLRWFRAPGVPFIFSSAQNIESGTHPRSAGWSGGSAPGRRGLLVQHRGRRDPQRKGLEGEWCSFRLGVDVERFRPPGVGRPPAPSPSGSSVASSPTRGWTSCSVPWPSTTGCGPRSSVPDRVEALAAGRHPRHTGPGAIPRSRGRGADP